MSGETLQNYVFLKHNAIKLQTLETFVLRTATTIYKKYCIILKNETQSVNDQSMHAAYYFQVLINKSELIFLDVWDGTRKPFFLNLLLAK